ncbi:protein O-mannosyl-transferase TMTC2-like [Bacillus rossius redtenbacheri]|uniref:protein O-mannosyl-transferase TMTC2-like n=1 Tax=Bacillus rossius redtenbacheri TaxID=93214 RepID=UPI002FDE8383
MMSSAPRVDSAVWASAVVAFVVYANTLDAGFVYDDSRAIVTNDDVRTDSPWSSLWLHDFWGTPLAHGGSHGSYRPLAVLSFRLNAWLSGAAAAPGFHLANALLHAAASGALAAWARRLLGAAALPAGLVHALHPVHTEAVAGLVGRADVGAALWCVAALLAYRSHLRRRGGADPGAAAPYLALTLVCCVGSMLSKEVGVGTPLLCVAYEALCHLRLSASQVLCFLVGLSSKGMSRSSARSTRWVLLCLCAMVAARAALTGGRLPTFSSADNPASRSGCLVTRTLTFLYLPAFNFLLLLCPVTLSFDWSMEAIPLVTDLLDLRNAYTVAFYSAFVYVTFKHLRCLGEDAQLGCCKNSTHVNANSRIPSGPGKAGIGRSVSLDKHCNSPAHRRCRNLFCEVGMKTVDPGGSVCCKNVTDINANVRSHVVPGPVKVGNAQLIFQHNHCASPTIRRRGCCPFEDYLKNKERKRRTSSLVLFGIAMMVVPFLPATNLLAHVGFVVAERVLYMPSMGYCLLVGQGMARLAAHPWRSVRRLCLLGCLLLLLSFGVKTWRRNFDWKDEESLYRSGIHINPPKAYGNLGIILNAQGRSAEAEQCYRKALFYRPNMADVHYNFGVLLQSQRRLAEAIHEFRLAIQFRPTLAAAHLGLAAALGGVGRDAEAEAVLAACCSLDGSGLKDPGSHEAAVAGCRLQRGRLALARGRPQEAVRVFLGAVRSLPPRYPAQSLFNSLGEAYSRLGEDSLAESWFRAALAASPGHVAAHLSYGQMLARNSSRLVEAEHWYRRAQTLAPGDPAVHRHYGQFLLDRGRPAEAARSFLAAVSLSGADYEDVVRAAASLRLSGDLREAGRLYEMAAGIRPQDPAALSNLGALRHVTGRLREAEALYRRALRLQPDDAVSLQNLRKLGRLRGRLRGRLELEEREHT